MALDWILLGEEFNKLPPQGCQRSQGILSLFPRLDLFALLRYTIVFLEIFDDLITDKVIVVRIITACK